MARRQLGAAPSATTDAATKGYVDAQDALRALLSHTHSAADLNITILGSGQDLDTYLTTGLYNQPLNSNTSLPLNYPEAAAGYFQVVGVGLFVWQWYWVYAATGADFYWRTKYNTGAFTAWQRAANDNPATGSANGLMTAADKAKVDSVIGPRATGWGAATGTVDKTAWVAYLAPTISNPPTQAEVQAVANALQANSRHLAALQQALTTHGLIGT